MTLAWKPSFTETQSLFIVKKIALNNNDINKYNQIMAFTQFNGKKEWRMK